MGGRSFGYEEVVEFFRAAGCTLLSPDYTGCNQVLLYICGACGAEAEVRFRTFKDKVSRGIRRGCEHCTIERMLETTLAKNGGVFLFQTEKFLQDREEKSLKRYGVKSPNQSEEIKQLRRDRSMERWGVPSPNHVPEIKLRAKEGFKAKYGVEHFMQNPDSKEKFRQTLMTNYGVPSLAFMSRRSSTEAQNFFNTLYSQMPEDTQDKCYFSPHSREFDVWYERKYYKYDFVHSRLKKAIEYNGSRFHPRPEQQDDEVGWCLFRPTRTVYEARGYEAHKLGALRARGFEVLVVWDYEVKHDLNSVLNHCLSFLGITPGTSLTSPPSSLLQSGF